MFRFHLGFSEMYLTIMLAYSNNDYIKHMLSIISDLCSFNLNIVCTRSLISFELKPTNFPLHY